MIFRAFSKESLTAGNIARVGFFLPAVTLFVLAMKSYPGSAKAYLFFTVCFNSLLLAGFREKRIFFDTFTGIFFWLGFWFKLSAILVLAGGNFTEPVGEFDFSAAAFDRALYVSSCGALALLAGSFVRQLFYSYPSVAPEAEGKWKVFYERYRRLIWAGFLLCALLLAAANAHFGIYQRGVPPRTILPFGLSGVLTLALLFGLASISAILLKLELLRKAPGVLPLVLATVECFLSNVSMLSRGMVLNGGALFLGYFSEAKVAGARFARSSVFGALAIFCALFISSFMAANYLRIYYFTDHELLSSPKISDSAKLHPFINRWVGMEGVMSVTSYSHRGRELWKEAWSESFSDSGTSFYDRTVIKDSPYLRPGVDEKHFITLPGIIAFFYYPGSLLFLIISLCLLALFCSALEVMIYRCSGGNLVLSALLGQVIAGRLAHFGYAPSRSYLLLAGILAVAVSAWAVERTMRLHRGEDD